MGIGSASDVVIFRNVSQPILQGSAMTMTFFGLDYDMNSY